jgi:hypothetical protein
MPVAEFEAGYRHIDDFAQLDCPTTTWLPSAHIHWGCWQ